jgi:uncharacterized Tic20 family protein
MNPVTAIPQNEDRKSRIWGMLCHLTALIGVIGIPFGNLAGPLIMWLLKRHTSPFVDEQGRESLNFQLSMTLYALIAFIMIYYFKIGMFPLFIVATINFVLVVIASIRAFSGYSYGYFFKIQFIKNRGKMPE